MMGVYLAIDLGAVTGYCVFEPCDSACRMRITEAGELALGGAAKKSQDLRLSTLYRILTEMHSAHAFSALVYERVLFATTARATQAWARYEGIVMLFCQHSALPLIGHPVGTVKKTFAGSGCVKKDAMVLRASELFPDVPVTEKQHNLADAIAVAYTHCVIGQITS